MLNERGVDQVKGGLSNDKGSISTLLVIFLPVLLLIMALVIDVGLLATARNNLQAAADMGALAAAQNLDLKELQVGEIVILEKEAIKDGKLWTEENLFRNLPNLIECDETIVKVKVYNGSADRFMYDQYSGRRLEDPTVCIVIEASHKFYFIHGVFGKQKIIVHADASVLKRD